MHIPVSECLDGHLYQIDARNASCGVYIAEKKAFEIRRVKFGGAFLDLELHWDSDDKHGTAKPIMLVEEVPETNGVDRLEYLYGWTGML